MIFRWDGNNEQILSILDCKSCIFFNDILYRYYCVIPNNLFRRLDNCENFISFYNDKSCLDKDCPLKKQDITITINKQLNISDYIIAVTSCHLCTFYKNDEFGVCRCIHPCTSTDLISFIEAKKKASYNEKFEKIDDNCTLYKGDIIISLSK